MKMESLEEVPLEEVILEEDEDMADFQAKGFTANYVGSLVILQTGAIIDLIEIFREICLLKILVVHNLVEEVVCRNLVPSHL